MPYCSLYHYGAAEEEFLLSQYVIMSKYWTLKLCTFFWGKIKHQNMSYIIIHLYVWFGAFADLKASRNKTVFELLSEVISYHKLMNVCLFLVAA